MTESSDRIVEVRENRDGTWDWHVIASGNNEETFGTHQGFTDADDAERALRHELALLHASVELHVERVPRKPTT